MKIILSGGGTGGHIYPALTIADEIKKLHPEAEIIFVGTQQGLEKDIIPRYGYPLKFIEVAGFRRSLSLDTLRSFGKLFTGLKDAYNILKKEKPDLVIGTGGFVCGPITFMAALHNVPACIQEQNAMPGVTNKILARFADCIMVNFEESAQYFVYKERIAVTGLPVRQEVLDADKKAGLQYFGFSADKTTLLVTGGSRGARSLNRAMVDAYPELVHHSDLQIIHLTGRLDYDDTIAAIAEKGIDVVDLGVPVISMHAPYEVISKADLFMTYKAFVAFNEA